MAKNVVICADGTGNQFGGHHTNVARFFGALDRSDPAQQVAAYFAGIGTIPSPSALTAVTRLTTRVASLAVGYGLLDLVAQMYAFLMAHYEPRDRIYLVGFSRGAFTIRVLIGLVSHQGIIKTRPTSPVVEAYPAGDPRAAVEAAYAYGDTLVRMEPQVFGTELARLTRWAYRDFRREICRAGDSHTAAEPDVRRTAAFLGRVRVGDPHRRDIGRDARADEPRNHGADGRRELFLKIVRTLNRYEAGHGHRHSQFVDSSNACSRQG